MQVVVDFKLIFKTFLKLFVILIVKYPVLCHFALYLKFLNVISFVLLYFLLVNINACVEEFFFVANSQYSSNCKIVLFVKFYDFVSFECNLLY